LDKGENLKKSMVVPFEFMSIQIEEKYDEVLKLQYGEYMTPVKGGCYHGDVIFDTDLPFEEWKKRRVK